MRARAQSTYRCAIGYLAYACARLEHLDSQSDSLPGSFNCSFFFSSGDFFEVGTLFLLWLLSALVSLNSMYVCMLYACMYTYVYIYISRLFLLWLLTQCAGEPHSDVC